MSDSDNCVKHFEFWPVSDIFGSWIISQNIVIWILKWRDKFSEMYEECFNGKKGPKSETSYTIFH